jgi:hypothetical protein
VTLSMVRTVHKVTTSAGFLVEPQNQGRQFVSSLTSKSVATVPPGLASNPVVEDLVVWPSNP